MAPPISPFGICYRTERTSVNGIEIWVCNASFAISIVSQATERIEACVGFPCFLAAPFVAHWNEERERLVSDKRLRPNAQFSSEMTYQNTEVESGYDVSTVALHVLFYDAGELADSVQCSSLSLFLLVASSPWILTSYRFHSLHFMGSTSNLIEDKNVRSWHSEF